MSFNSKWNTRQISLELLSYGLCFTTLFVILPIAIDFKELWEFGFDAYPEYKLNRKNPDVRYVAHVFYHLSILPLAKYLLATIPADILLRRFVYELRD